jgi:glycosyltransferase involved in cell wall biosynthesis
MISVVTPTYNTSPDVLARTWASLKAQTFTDWEWVVYDDSTNDQVWRQLWGYCADERFRIVPLRGISNSGSIGYVKRIGFMAARGDILVELDHDDELTPDCLQELSDAFEDDVVGFAYSDWSEHFSDGTTGRYPEGWAFGYGSEYQEGSDWVMAAPVINRVTAGHIVSAPNHVRAWRASAYRALGGHNPELPVADDYELVVRTLLEYDWKHIPKRLYKQHIGPQTAQRQRNAEIQQWVADLSNSYSDALDERFGHEAE